MKKLALFLSIVLSLGLFIPFAASAEMINVSYEILSENPVRTTGVDSYELLENGSFETLKSDTMIYGWAWTSHIGAANTYFGCGLVDRSTDAHSGEYSVHVTPLNEGERVDTLVNSQVSIIAGETYEFSVWFKRLSGTREARVDITFAGTNKGVKQEYGFIKLPFGDVKEGDGWVKKTVRFTAPEYANKCTPSMRVWGPNEVLWDDVSLLCITDKMPVPEMPEEKPSIKDFEVKNAGFEDDVAGELLNIENGWEIIGEARCSDEYAHTGEKSVVLRTTGGSQDAIATYYMLGLEKGATYQISAWLMNPEDTRPDTGFWITYFSTETIDWSAKETQLGEDKGARWGVRKNLEWVKYIAEFTPPDDAKLALIYFRHRTSPGTVYMDDVSVYMVKPPNALNADTDENIYYSEWETGEVAATPYVMADAENTRAEFSFVELDGTETHKETITGLTDKIKYVFRTEWMAEKGKRYHIRMRVYGPDNALVQEEEWPVYQYDRPTYLGADGIFRKNGREVPITFGTGVKMDQFNQLPEKGGVTVVQFYSDSSGYGLKEKMDMAYERGMFVLAILYSGGQSAGHPDRIDATKITVENIKDHPALFGYKVHDEPYQKATPAEELIAAYTAIRDLDPHHPIYIDDSPIGCYDWVFRYCDILDVDYYGGNSKDSATLFTDIWDMVREASKGRKPFTILQQASKYCGYIPSYDELRHQLYQVFFSGSSGYGYHILGQEHEDEPAYMDRPVWQEIVDKWAPWERDFMLGCFVTGEYTFVNYAKSDSVLWGTFTDGTDLYAIVLNRKKTEETPATIPLSDGMGTMQVGDFVATRMTGESARVSGSGSLSITLAPQEAVVWKITPIGSSLNVSHLKNSSFNDVIYYPWAYNAIATLEEKGIVNRVSETWYGPPV